MSSTMPRHPVVLSRLLPSRWLGVLPGCLALWVLIACLAAPAVQSQTLFRCQDGQGGTSFQQMPCPAGTGGQIEVRPVTTEMGQNILDRAARNARGEVSEDELLARLGPPTVVNTDVVDGVVTKQFVYRFSTGTQYHYSRDGIVYASQDRPRADRSARRAHQPCYSRQAIANARTSASSIILSPEEKQAALDRVKAMEDCRR